MAEPMIRTLHGAFLGNPNLRQIVLPGAATAIGATVTAGNNPAWGVWIDVAAQADIVLETLVVGLALDTQDAACILTVDIGTTLSVGVNYDDAAAINAAAAAVIAGAHRMQVRTQLILIAASEAPVIQLPYPVYVPAGVGILARGMTVGGGETVNVSVFCLQGWTT